MDEEIRKTENNEDLKMEFDANEPDAAIPLIDEFPTIEIETALPAETTSERAKTSETAESGKPAESTQAAINAELLEKMNKLLVEFQGKLKYDAKKQEQIDRLYDENCVLKRGVIESFKKQLILGLIEKIDMAEKNLAGFRTIPYTEENYRTLISAAEELPKMFQETLIDLFGVHFWRSDEGSAFEPSRQHILRTTSTSEKSKNKTLARSIRRGYQTEGGAILRPELVDVFLYREPEPSEK